MHSVHANLQVCVGGHVYQFVEVHVQPELDLLFIFALVSVLNRLDQMRALNYKHVAESLACDQQHYSLCLLCVSCWDGSLTCTSKVSSVSACCAHDCSRCYCNSFIYLCSFMFFLSCFFNTCNSFFFPSSSFAQSSCRIVTS